MMYEAVQFLDPPFVRGEEPGDPIETVLGKYEDEASATAAARSARSAYRKSGAREPGWWLVRETGSTKALWIADSASDREFVLDLRTQELIPID